MCNQTLPIYGASFGCTSLEVLSESGFSLATHCLWPFWLDSSLSLHLRLLKLSHYLSDCGGTNRVLDFPTSPLSFQSETKA